jgi:hypothetical protein
MARLILGIGGHLARHRQVLKKRQNLGNTYVTWVCMVAKREKPVDPGHICLFRADGIASASNFRDQCLSPCHLRVTTYHGPLALRLR